MTQRLDTDYGLLLALTVFVVVLIAGFVYFVG